MNQNKSGETKKECEKCGKYFFTYSSVQDICEKCFMKKFPKQDLSVGMQEGESWEKDWKILIGRIDKWLELLSKGEKSIGEASDYIFSQSKYLVRKALSQKDAEAFKRGYEEGLKAQADKSLEVGEARGFFKGFTNYIKNTPMGVSQWREHGKKFGYWDYFKKEVEAEVLKRLEKKFDEYPVYCEKCGEFLNDKEKQKLFNQLKK